MSSVTTLSVLPYPVVASTRFNQSRLGQRDFDTLTHWKCAVIRKRTNIKQNKVHRRKSVLPDSLGRKPNCINPDAATVGYNKGSKRPKARPGRVTHVVLLESSPELGQLVMLRLLQSQVGVHSRRSVFAIVN